MCLRLTLNTQVHHIQASPVSTSEGCPTPLLDSSTNGLSDLLLTDPKVSLVVQMQTRPFLSFNFRFCYFYLRFMLLTEDRMSRLMINKEKLITTQSSSGYLKESKYVTIDPQKRHMLLDSVDLDQLGWGCPFQPFTFFMYIVITDSRWWWIGQGVCVIWVGSIFTQNFLRISEPYHCQFSDLKPDLVQNRYSSESE